MDRRVLHVYSTSEAFHGQVATFVERSRLDFDVQYIKEPVLGRILAECWACHFFLLEQGICEWVVANEKTLLQQLSKMETYGFHPSSSQDRCHTGLIGFKHIVGLPWSERLLSAKVHLSRELLTLRSAPPKPDVRDLPKTRSYSSSSPHRREGKKSISIAYIGLDFPNLFSLKHGEARERCVHREYSDMKEALNSFRRYPADLHFVDIEQYKSGGLEWVQRCANEMYRPLLVVIEQSRTIIDQSDEIYVLRSGADFCISGIDLRKSNWKVNRLLLRSGVARLRLDSRDRLKLFFSVPAPL